MTESGSRIFVEDSGENWDKEIDEYSKVMSRISQLQNEA